MEVQNHTQDFAHFNCLQNHYAIKKAPGTINRRAYERLLREAKAFLAGHAINWADYEAPTATFFDMTTAQVEWRRKGGTALITVTQIWFDKKTGQIHQAGTQSGDLVY